MRKAFSGFSLRKMRTINQNFRASHSRDGFTLTETMIAIAMVVIMLQAIVYGYTLSANRAEWSAYSLAAQSLASQGVEQARAAKWDPQAYPGVDELSTGAGGSTNYSSIDKLDVPIAGAPVYATNYVSIINFSLNPLYRQIKSDCVWRLGNRGPFTNTILTLRAPDQ